MRRFTLRCLGEGGPPIHNRRVARILSSRGAISRSAREGLSPSNEQGSRRCVSTSSPISDEHSVATCRMAWRGWPKNTASATACQWFVIVEHLGPATAWSSHVGAAIAHDGDIVSARGAAFFGATNCGVPIFHPYLDGFPNPLPRSQRVYRFATRSTVSTLTPLSDCCRCAALAPRGLPQSP